MVNLQNLGINYLVKFICDPNYMFYYSALSVVHLNYLTIIIILEGWLALFKTLAQL